MFSISGGERKTKVENHGIIDGIFSPHITRRI
jgi:hypothetical protein